MFLKFALAAAAIGATIAILLLAATSRSSAQGLPKPTTARVDSVSVGMTVRICASVPAKARGDLVFAFTSAKTKAPVGKILSIDTPVDGRKCVVYQTPADPQKVRVAAVFYDGLRRPGVDAYNFTVTGQPPRP